MLRTAAVSWDPKQITALQTMKMSHHPVQMKQQLSFHVQMGSEQALQVSTELSVTLMDDGGVTMLTEVTELQGPTHDLGRSSRSYQLLYSHKVNFLSNDLF